MEYITVKEAADKWGYGENTIRKWCQTGLLSVTYKAENSMVVGESRLVWNAPNL